jgi:hypothetical protein
MQCLRFSLLFGCGVLALACALAGVQAQAATPFTITASNVTMPSSGNGYSQYSVTNIPVTGTMSISTSYAGTETQAKMPTCANTPPVVYQVKAGGTLSGTIACYPYGAGIPASLPQGRRSSRAAAAGLAFAGALLFGLGLRRRMRCWLVMTVLAAGTLAGLAGIGACGGSSNGMTPGTYPYTFMATNSPTSGLGPVWEATTTINVTVP